MNDSIIKLFKELNELYNTSCNCLEPLIIDIINNKNKDIKLIESYLDTLLDIPTEKSYKLFMLLCDYYKNINKEDADFYIKEYKKIME